MVCTVDWKVESKESKVAQMGLPPDMNQLLTQALAEGTTGHVGFGSDLKQQPAQALVGIDLLGR